MVELRSTSNCGVFEIVHVQEYSDASRLLRDIITQLNNLETPPPVLYMTSNEQSSILRDFAICIGENGAGECLETDWHYNDNSENAIKLLVWELPAYVDLTAWAAEEDARIEALNASQLVEETQVQEEVDGAFTVGNIVRHQTFGLGVVRIIRETGVARIGVEFLNGGTHNLAGAIETNRGLWVNGARLSHVNV